MCKSKNEPKISLRIFKKFGSSRDKNQRIEVSVGKVTDPKEVSKQYEDFFITFPDVYLEFLDDFSENFHNAHRWIMKATHKNDSGETPDDVALPHSNPYNANILSFANNINPIQGDTPFSGLRSALTRAMNNYAPKNNLV